MKAGLYPYAWTLSLFLPILPVDCKQISKEFPLFKKDHRGQGSPTLQTLLCSADSRNEALCFFFFLPCWFYCSNPRQTFPSLYGTFLGVVSVFSHPIRIQALFLLYFNLLWNERGKMWLNKKTFWCPQSRATSLNQGWPTLQCQRPHCFSGSPLDNGSLFYSPTQKERPTDNNKLVGRHDKSGMGVQWVLEGGIQQQLLPNPNPVLGPDPIVQVT